MLGVTQSGGRAWPAITRASPGTDDDLHAPAPPVKTVDYGIAVPYLTHFIAVDATADDFARR